MSTSGEVTQLLLAWNSGDQAALEELMPLVYKELHRLASNCLRWERQGHTIEATALVNEAYLRLVDQRQVEWQNRTHFFSIAARIMRRILVQYARDRKAEKRGGGAQRVSLEKVILLAEERNVDIIALDNALNLLAQNDPRKSQLVELRFFSGLTFEEASEILGISLITAKRDWAMAKAWLHRELQKEKPQDEF
jgi:RNA polymerase sigma factor (TIGR02999 family)